MTPLDDRPTITICGLGPGAPDLLTERTATILDRPDPLFLRTSRHPGAERFTAAVSFDPIYDGADSFAEVYTAITEAIVGAAVTSGQVTYCVPGSPLVLERSVAQLRARDDVAVEVIPAVSFLDETWARLAVDPIEDGVRLIDGHRFAVEAAGERGPLLVAHTHARWVLSDIKLALLESDVGGDQNVIILQRLGTGDEAVFEVKVDELDRRVEADHLTSLYLPTVAVPIGRALMGSVELMRRLRLECPWDAKQDHASLRTYLLEETYEVLDVLDRIAGASIDPDDDTADDTADRDAAVMDRYAELEGELGDLWLQILFHSRLASEAGHFDMADVADTLTAKMISRHPHVFGTDDPDLTTTASGGPVTPAGVEAQWDQIKAAESRRSSVLDGVPAALPSLARAAKIVTRVAGAHGPPELGRWAERLGLGTDPGVRSGRAEQADPVVKDESDLGRLLMAVVEAGRVAGVDPEQALRSATNSLAESVRSHERRHLEDTAGVHGVDAIAEASGPAVETAPLSWVVG